MGKYLKRTILYCAITLILGIVLGLMAELIRHPRGDPQTVTNTDTVTKKETVVVHDTVLKEVPVKFPVVRTEVREVYVPLNPNIEHEPMCSVEVAVPITQKQYSDSDYTAWVSGYNPSLDSIQIYRRTTHIITPKPSRLHLSVGVGAVYNGRLSPGIFVGVSYSFKEIRL